LTSPLRLQLYQFGGKCNDGIIAQVLVMALMQLPSSDFSLCLCLLPEAVAQVPTVAQVRESWCGAIERQALTPNSLASLSLSSVFAVGRRERTAKAVKPARVLRFPGLLDRCGQREGNPEQGGRF